MPKRKRVFGRPFAKGSDDDRINRTGPPEYDLDDNPTAPKRIREPQSIFDQISRNQCGGEIPPGARLRPKPDSDPLEETGSGEIGQNWVIDEQKLLEATNAAIKLHDNGKRNHMPVLQKRKSIQKGFGVSFSFECGFKRCKFESPLYKLYKETESGQPVPNLAVGVAMAKTELTPKTVEVFGATLNLGTPGTTTLQKSYNTTLESTNDLAESAMANNRAVVTSATRLLGNLKPGEIPGADGATDGQYALRDYHFPTGKSDSVSVPVIENVTGFGLLTEHTNLSHRDGTLPPDVHINAAETLATQMNVEKSYTARKLPLYYNRMTTDGDTSMDKALQAARVNVGESRPLKRRSCHFHGFGAGTKFEIFVSMKCFIQSFTPLFIT